MSVITAINDHQFAEKVLGSTMPVLLDVSSPECIICRTMDERIREVAPKFKGTVKFYSLDVNKNKVWRRYEVRAVPTILYFKAGEMVLRHDIFPEKEEMAAHLKRLIKK